VRVEIEGRQVDAVYRIPRTALRDNISVWVAGEDDTLDIRRIETAWRDSHTVLIRSGLNPGDRLIVSDLPVPVAGMPLRVEEETAETPPRPGKSDGGRKDTG